MKIIKSPLRYPGGKSRAVKLLSSLVEKCDSFYEPFCGGASLGLYIAQTQNCHTYLNDINHSVYSFWESALNNNDELISKIIKQYNKPKDKVVFNELKDAVCRDVVSEGSKFFCLNRMTFSGTAESGGYSKSAHLHRFTNTSIDRVSDLKNLPNNITVENKDYREFLSGNFTDNAFVFLDPPYYSATKSALYGKNGVLHKEFSHEELFEFLKISTSKFNFFMTYDNCDFIRNMYLKDFYVYEWKLQYGMTNKKVNENNELVISNYELKESELLKRVHQ